MDMELETRPTHLPATRPWLSCLNVPGSSGERKQWPVGFFLNDSSCSMVAAGKGNFQTVVRLWKDSPKLSHWVLAPGLGDHTLSLLKTYQFYTSITREGWMARN